jgi:hypothetical protein
MFYERSDVFKTDWKSLTDEERALVRAVLPTFNKAAGSVAGPPYDKRKWPKSLRIHDVGPGIWSVTFHFAGPDLRATFEWVTVDGEPCIRWRRIGRHDIYGRP